jgi:indole-3-glycerol phosphate synthase
MSDFLDSMAAASAQRAAAFRNGFAGAGYTAPSQSLTLSGFDLIAEIKDRSPAEGQLVNTSIGRAERARLYAEAGAAAISVLTEPTRFDGSMEHLREVVDAVAGTGVPVMRKDFLVDELQLVEAREAGASGALLIAAMLPGERLQNMLDEAEAHGLFVLLECFDPADIARVDELLAEERNRLRAAQGDLLLGINTRNLRTLAVDTDRLATLAPSLPSEISCVAESGLHTAADAARVRRMGYRVALVGTALMRAADPAALVRSMLAAGREEAGT